MATSKNTCKHTQKKFRTQKPALNIKHQHSTKTLSVKRAHRKPRGCAGLSSVWCRWLLAHSIFVCFFLFSSYFHFLYFLLLELLPSFGFASYAPVAAAQRFGDNTPTQHTHTHRHTLLTCHLRVAPLARPLGPPTCASLLYAACRRGNADKSSASCLFRLFPMALDRHIWFSSVQLTVSIAPCANHRHTHTHTSLHAYIHTYSYLCHRRHRQPNSNKIVYFWALKQQQQSA